MADLIKPTPYKISTITATGSVNVKINLGVFFENVIIISHEDLDVNGVVFAEYGKNKGESIKRGINIKAKNTRKNKNAPVLPKRFDNQVTLLFRQDQAVTNVKLFKNGNIQMTGLKTCEQGVKTIDHIVQQISHIYEILGNEDVVEDYNSMNNSNFRVRLINSDFRLGVEIKRDLLCKLVQTKYHTYCNFEPCVYPGVKIQYYCNSNHFIPNGLCKCTEPCNGKGSSIGNGNCKKITIAVFQSGCVIITGAQTLEQISESYRFICDVVQTNLKDVQKKSPPIF